jgi:hypothetical protein
VAISLGKKVAGAALAGFVALGAGAVAFAADGSSSAPTAAPAVTTAGGTSAAKAAGKAPGAKGKAALGILRRSDHGDIEVQVKGTKGATPTWQTVTFDRGSVTDIAADHITVARPDGQSVTLTISSTTKFRGVTSWQDIQKGKPAVVVSRSGAATQILQAKAAATPTPAPATTVPAAG